MAPIWKGSTGHSCQMEGPRLSGIYCCHFSVYRYAYSLFLLLLLLGCCCGCLSLLLLIQLTVLHFVIFQLHVRPPHWLRGQGELHRRGQAALAPQQAKEEEEEELLPQH